MPHPLISRFIDVVVDHRKLLSLPGSPTGGLVARWAKVMTFPQVLAPVLIVFGAPPTDVILIFLARYVAMHVVYLLDQYMPYTRALGLCHLVTFGPLFVYFTLDFGATIGAWDGLSPIFVCLYSVITLCLYLDLRDLILHMVGQPFPCYVRDHQRLGNLSLEDPRANAPVSMFNRLFW